MRQIAIVLGIVVFLSLAIQPVYSQSENPIRMVYGEDRIVVPGERAGALRLGIGRKEFTDPKMFGPPTFSRPILMKWRYKATGDVLSWQNSHKFRAGFCDTNGRMFLAMIESYYPTLPLTTPEGFLTTKNPEEDLVRAYGKPDAEQIPPLVGSSDTPVVVFANGLVTARSADRSARNWFWMLGAFNPKVCENNDPVLSTYIRWLGHPTVTKVMLARTTDENCNSLTEVSPAVGDLLPVFAKDELVCMIVDLSFTPAAVQRTIPFVRRYRSKTDSRWGTDIAIPRTIEPGQTTLTIKHWMGRNPSRPIGPWSAETLVIDPAFGGEKLIAARDFLVR